MKDDELLHKWINNTISEEELEVFKNRPEYDSLVSLYKLTDQVAIPKLNQSAMLNDILATPKQDAIAVPIESKKLSLKWMKYGVAAAFVLFAGLLFWPKDKMIEYNIADNQRIEGNLPDQSNFVLNADSKLNYDQNSWDKNRVVNLEGEAFFSVEKGSTFTVKTSNGTVMVLGTQFNVKSRGGKLWVSCKEGRVQVKNAKQELSEILIADQSLSIEGGNKLSRWEDKNVASWRDGMTRMREVTLGDVIDELQRQFDINIESSGLNLLQKLNCNFQHKDLNLALETSLVPLGIQYEKISDTQIKLSN